MEKHNQLFEELLKKLQGLDTIQTSGDWAENLPQNLWLNMVGNFKEVATNVNTDPHRWYEVSTTVLEMWGRYLGIRYITNLFSESSTYEDCYHTMEFFEMKEVQTVSYEPI